MFCSKCGAAAADSARFCPKCGAPLSVPDGSASRLKISSAGPAATPAPPKKTTPPSASTEQPLSDAGRHVKKAAKRKEPGQPGSGLWLTGILLAAVLVAVVGAAAVCFSAHTRTAPDEAVLEDSAAELITIMAEGNAAYSLEDYELALDFYLEAMERFPQEPDVLCRLADAYYALSENDNALQYYQMALMLYGEDGSMPVMSAQNYYNLTEE